MTDDDRILQFMNRCAERLVERAAAADAASEAATGARAFQAAVAASTPLPCRPASVPVVDATVGRIDTGPDGGPLAAALVAVTPLLPWVPTFRATDEGTEFGLALFDKMRDLGGLTAGLMWVGPGCQYPLHHHPPQELYLTLTGRARFRWGGAKDLRPVEPDATLYNHPDDWHTSIAEGDDGAHGGAPFVALYVTWP